MFGVQLRSVVGRFFLHRLHVTLMHIGSEHERMVVAWHAHHPVVFPGLSSGWQAMVAAQARLLGLALQAQGS